VNILFACLFFFINKEDYKMAGISVPTVAVVNTHDSSQMMIINKSQYNEMPEYYTLWEDRKKPKKAKRGRPRKVEKVAASKPAPKPQKRIVPEPPVTKEEPVKEEPVKEEPVAKLDEKEKTPEPKEDKKIVEEKKAVDEKTVTDKKVTESKKETPKKSKK
jgi:hypothetical protein